ncbi:phosphotransferase family protein [Candidatus Hodarchaeum mangrovi]
MEITENFREELIQELKNQFPEQKGYKTDNFIRLEGADTITYSFVFHYGKDKKTFVLRIFRSITDQAEREFSTLNALHSANLSVPKPYLWKKDSPNIKKSYLIMERIPGILLANYFSETHDENKRNKLMHLFIRKLAELHQFKWRNQNSFVKIPNIENDPYFFVNRIIDFPKQMVKKFRIIELEPLIMWLEKHKQKCEEIVLLHGDYHMNNVIVTPEKNLVLIDWADIKLGDFRHDLAFAIVTTSSTGKDVTKQFVNQYQSLTGKKVENLDYFLILSSLNNILRGYSALIQPEITNETETTRYMFFEVYRSYSQYLFTLVQRITRIPLPTAAKALCINYEGNI